MGVGISTILVACTKVQRAIVVLLTLASALASHFKVYVKFFLCYGQDCQTKYPVWEYVLFKFDIKVFPVMGKVLLGKLSCTQTGKIQ